MTAIKLVVKVNPGATRAPAYVQRIDRTHTRPDDNQPKTGTDDGEIYV
jgi:hypothetical protein